MSVSVRTLQRWRTWWQLDFPLTQFWRSVRERLPLSLLERFDADAMTDRLTQALRFIAPLSTPLAIK